MEFNLDRASAASSAVVLLHGHHLHHLHLLVHLHVGLVLGLHGQAGLLEGLLTGLVSARLDQAEEDDAGEAAAEHEHADDDGGDDATSDCLAVILSTFVVIAGIAPAFPFMDTTSAVAAITTRVRVVAHFMIRLVSKSNYSL